MRKKIPLIILLLMTAATGKSLAQVTITGPRCVMTAAICEYAITGTWDSVSTMQVCLSGGVFAGAADTVTCMPTGAPVGRILVLWDSSGGRGTIQVTSSSGNATLAVAVTGALWGGRIDSGSRFQRVSHDSVPATITCTRSFFGSCGPVYVYQWQQSPDRVNWANISGATGQNMAIDSALIQTTFYRRMVTETGSGSVAYSDIAAVFVGITIGWNESMGQPAYCKREDHTF
jgi:hypothetical protein